MCRLLLRCRDGVLVSYRGSYECLGEQTPFNGLWRLEFRDGDLVLDQAGVLWRVRGEQRSLLYEEGQEERSSDELLLDTLHEAIAEGTEAPTSGRRNLDTLRAPVPGDRAGPGGLASASRRRSCSMVAAPLQSVEEGSSPCRSPPSPLAKTPRTKPGQQAGARKAPAQKPGARAGREEAGAARSQAARAPPPARPRPDGPSPSA